ncbi:MAG: DUF2796 domain-containing protein [Gammaproteobacteria bacterium SHHR-1]|uniref:DUF2796 domain-containing protein n=1 Tax=Magnetovirga frankeli TaxID=947516 RepID=UPI00129349B7|nr:DUF2796 domain-containing protein [gamma proteobacterium SS-5]
MPSAKILSLFLFCCLPLLLPPALAEEAPQRQHSAHVHGQAQLNLVLDGDTLLIELQSPAANLLGFEHAPRTAEQREYLQHTAEGLRQAQRLFVFTPQDACQLQQVALDSPLLEAEAGEDHDHADISAHYHYQCQAPERIEVRLFAEFPAIQVLHAQMVSSDTQQQKALTAEQAGMDF